MVLYLVEIVAAFDLPNLATVFVFLGTELDSTSLVSLPASKTIGLLELVDEFSLSLEPFSFSPSDVLTGVFVGLFDF